MRYIILWCLSVSGAIDAAVHMLDTLEHISAFVKEPAVQEAPASDNNDWFNPNFYSFYQKLQPTVMQRIAHLAGLWEPLWDPHELQELLVRLGKTNATHARTGDMQDDHVDIALSPHAHVILFGDLHGALHSLYRDLHELYRQGKIDNQLRIQDDHVRICFLGDVIDRSPYSLETLTIVLHLLEQNPQQVWYLRGRHETDGYWRNFSVRQQLLFAFNHVLSTDLPLQSELDAFFAKLPKEIYLSVANDADKRIRLSHQKRSVPYQPLSQETRNAVLSTVASITGEDRSYTLTNSDGAQLLGYRYGAAEWSLFSAPVWVYQTYFQFMHDAFSILQFGSRLSETTLSLYHRRVDRDASFAPAETYDVITGQKLPDKERNGAGMREQLRIGSSIALSRGIGVQGTSVEHGMNVAMTHANATGGVQGHMLRPFVFDDRYMPYRAYANVKHLMEGYNAHIMLTPTGTQTVQAYTDLVQQANGAILFPITGAAEFRLSRMQHMVHFRPSYAQEGSALIEHMLDTYQVRKFAFLYQDDEFGRSLRDAAIAKLKERGVQDWLAVPYVSGQAELQQQAHEIYQYNPTAIGFFATVAATEDVLRNLDAAFLIGRQLFGSSDLGVYSFRRSLRKRGLPFTIAHVVPDPEISELQIARDFRERMDAIGWPYDVFAFEGYIAAQLMLESLRNLSGNVTVQNMLSWFEKLRAHQFKGLTLTFDAETRSLSQEVAIARISENAD